MRSFRAALRSHRWSVPLALAIFVGGTNYCVAAAIAGPAGRLACGMTSAAGTSAADASAPACHGHPSKAPSGRAAQRGPMPCCITLAPAAASPDAKPATETVLVLPPAIAPAPAPVAAWSEAPVVLDTGPPEPPGPGTHSTRAPPLG